MNFVNLTPHAVVVVGARGEIILTVPQSGQLARCTTTREVTGEAEVPDGVRIPLTRTKVGRLEGLPEPQDGTIFIVSLIAATAAKMVGRVDDVVVPDDAVRDKDGRVIGCQAFARQ